MDQETKTCIDNIYKAVNNNPLKLIFGRCRFHLPTLDWETIDEIDVKISEEKDIIDFNNFIKFIEETKPKISLETNNTFLGTLTIMPDMPDGTFNINPNQPFNLILRLKETEQGWLDMIIKINETEFVHNCGEIGEFIVELPFE